MSFRRTRFGFTFIELLVTLVICSVLYLTALGPIRAYQDGKKRIACAENLRKLHLVLSLYAHENRGVFPHSEGMKTSNEAFAMLVPGCTSDPSLFCCPLSKAAVSYSYVTGLDKNVTGVLAMDSAVNHGAEQGNAVFVDGHVETFSPASLPPLPAVNGARLLHPIP